MVSNSFLDNLEFSGNGITARKTVWLGDFHDFIVMFDGWPTRACPILSEWNLCNHKFNNALDPKTAQIFWPPATPYYLNRIFFWKMYLIFHFLTSIFLYCNAQLASLNTRLIRIYFWIVISPWNRLIIWPIVRCDSLNLSCETRLEVFISTNIYFVVIFVLEKKMST